MQQVSPEAADYPGAIYLTLLPKCSLVTIAHRKETKECLLSTECPPPDKSWIQKFLWIWDIFSEIENQKIKQNKNNLKSTLQKETQKIISHHSLVSG